MLDIETAIPGIDATLRKARNALDGEPLDYVAPGDIADAEEQLREAVDHLRDLDPEAVTADEIHEAMGDVEAAQQALEDLLADYEEADEDEDGGWDDDDPDDDE